MKYLSNGNNVCVLVKKVNKWGQFCPELNFELIKCNYSSANQVPFHFVEPWLSKYIYLVKNKYGTSTHILNNSIGAESYLAQNEQTLKWGLFNTNESVIPLEYDSIILFNAQISIAIVIKANKIGSFNLLKNTPSFNIPCNYDDYKLVLFSNGQYQLALLKNNKWGWIDWKTGKMMSDFKYDSFYQLPKL